MSTEAQLRGGKLESLVDFEMIRESARLSFFGSFVYPILFLAAWWLSPVRPSPEIAAAIMSIFLMAGAVRIFVSFKILRGTSIAPATGKWCLRISTIIQIVTWCLFSSLTIYKFGQGSLCTLSFLTIASGLAAGGTFSLAPDPFSAGVYLLCVYLTHAPHCLFFAESTTFLAATIQGIYCALQISMQHKRLRKFFHNNESLKLKTSELELANQASRQAQTHAEQAAKAKGEFVATMSHEIRTPLHGVLGSNTLLLDSHLNEEQREYAEMIRNSGEALLAVIDDILDLSKLEAGHLGTEKTTFNLPELIGKCQVVVNQKIREKRLQILTQIDDSVPTFVEGDANSLRQILLNLLSNAVKFTEQGRIELNTRAETKAPGGLWISFEVLDTGIGIPDEFRRDLFEPFRQATRTEGGTGLGLAISARLANAMGGTLTANPRPEGGSQFILTAPFETAQEAKVPKASIRLEMKPETKARVLIVEDNPTSRKLLQRLLSKVGIECDLACDGVEAIDAVQGEVCYDLILMDCYMPRMDGFEATEKILSYLAVDSPPIVAVTANVSQQDRKRCEQSGMVGFLSKPIRLKALQEILNLHLN